MHVMYIHTHAYIYIRIISLMSLGPQIRCSLSPPSLSSPTLPHLMPPFLLPSLLSNISL